MLHPELTREEPGSLQRYFEAMGSPQALQDKLHFVAPILLERIRRGEPTKVLSLGAGGAQVETFLTRMSPLVSVITLDLSEAILNLARANFRSEQQRCTDASLTMSFAIANALSVPLAAASMDVVLLSSLGHEVVSYQEKSPTAEREPLWQYGPMMVRLYQEAARCLKRGGKLVNRDFVMPENSQELVRMQVGTSRVTEKRQPLTFVRDFANDFRGHDLSEVQQQILHLENENAWEPGSCLTLTKAAAFEFFVHYSWRGSYDDEVDQRYAYLTNPELKRFIETHTRQSGSQLTVTAQHAYMQPEYTKYVTNDGLSFREINGNTWEPSGMTGVTIAEKTPLATTAK